MRPLLLGLLPALAASAPLERIWLTHRTDTPTHVVVNWETAAISPSVVEFGPSAALGESAKGPDGRIHHVEIPMRAGSGRMH